ncbi:Protein GLUTAMINE DUMPER 3 [Carex littledalei]|uniref:Protein GLUTAMINE DUMPER 3 n=1 Tax=Carex littledalei TaxID=544730 RepID=A0A833R597_9POAL|nr:Protein GLUTAMINE DUMPER 3 [Carex littledalei]
MRPLSSSGTGGSGSTWAFPVPILYGCIFLLLAVILVSLIVLAFLHCRSGRKTSASKSLDSTEGSVVPSTTEPRIVVIMAGDDKATYLAKPI